MTPDLSIQSLPAGMLVLGEDLRIQRANDQARVYLATSSTNPVASPITDHVREPQRILDALDPSIEQAIRVTDVVPEADEDDADVPTLDLHAQFDPDVGWLCLLIDVNDRVALRAELDRLQAELAQSEQARSKMDAIQAEMSETASQVDIIGSSAPMLAMLQQVDRIAPADSTVLIHGETGSGKELVAKAIQSRSARAGRAFISVNCASLPETLIESELFGHERGAFTGAERQRLGKFELADSGTLFLDEIGELSLAAQAKLLRVLQEGTLQRVGGTETIEVDVRLIAATHRDLAQQVQRGKFREDLFYRLNVFRIEVPPLRDRKEDIRALVEFFHEMHARRMDRPVVPISQKSMRRLLAYRWPGNVRELENAVERATLLSVGDELDIEIAPGPVTTPDMAGAPGTQRDTASIPRDVLLDLTIDQLQRLQIMHALETCSYKVFGDAGAAAKLKINPQTLLSRMDKLGIPRPRAMRKALGGVQ